MKINDLVRMNDTDWEKFKTEAFCLEHGPLCPVCEADLDAWREAFGEPHYCILDDCVVVGMRGEG